MNNIENYVPIMTPKRGEFFAIKALDGIALTRFTPLFNIHPIPLLDGKRDRSLNQHLDGIILNLEKYWPQKKLFLIDYSLIDLDYRMEDGKHPVTYICDMLKEKNMFFSPVIGLDRDSAYLNAIKYFLEKNPGCIISLRLFKDDLIDMEETKKIILSIFATLKINFSLCHLLIDFTYIEQNDIDKIIELLSEFNQIVPLNQWCSFVLIASGFPLNMSEIPANSNKCIFWLKSAIDSGSNRPPILVDSGHWFWLKSATPIRRTNSDAR